MGLFDGPITKFAKTFCDYLDTRVEACRANAAKAKNEGDHFTAMSDLITANTLVEISNALKTIAEL